MPFRRHREGGDLSAIFVHAGAGFHSYANEKLHLKACSDAAQVAMTILKNGGEAVDAVEMAIKIMEDREITNAGYGSNLDMDGEVECDATIVDHYGRSGAVGAVGQIKNPISLARLVLDESTKPLSLQRVPPNLLVGQGAVDFAFDRGMPVLPPDYLISKTSRDRWSRWRQDLKNAEEQERQSRPENEVLQYQESVYHLQAEPQPRLTPLSEGLSPPTSPRSSTSLTRPGPPSYPLTNSAADTPSIGSFDSNGFIHVGADHSLPRPLSRDKNIDGPGSAPPAEPSDSDVTMDDQVDWALRPPKIPRHDGSSESSDTVDSIVSKDIQWAFGARQIGHAKPYPSDQDDDMITDTVGAIAVDCFGNIAAGSSSGGIGMKHKGRVGPAALVGVGSAVYPLDRDDPNRVSVATVTSGTGEHMATTMAAGVCADRIYNNVRKKKIGGFEYATEDEALRSMIDYDFMTHSSVKRSHCAGAIGVMAVKKTKDGIFLFFGHNTDSFALASMHSEDKKPVCTMSRSTGHGATAQGGRAAKVRRYRR